MSSVVSIVIGILCAIYCRKKAIEKGRGPLTWTILGFLFGIIALIVITVLKPKYT